MLAHPVVLVQIRALSLLARSVVATSATTRTAVSNIDPGTGAIAAATIAAVTLLVTTAVTQVLQFRRDRRIAEAQYAREHVERRRAASAAHRERLQVNFAAILLAANAYVIASRRLVEGARPGESNNKVRLQKLGDELDAAQRGIDVARAALMLDGASSDILLHFSELSASYAQLVANYNMSALLDGQARPDLEEQAQRVHEAQERMAEAMRARLAELDKDEENAVQLEVGRLRSTRSWWLGARRVEQGGSVDAKGG